MTVLLAFLVVVVGIVYGARYRRERALASAGPAGTVSHAESMSRVGWASLITLAAAVTMWALTNAALPIFYAAAIAGMAFVLALIAVVARHDRSPLLLIPLLGVPIAVAFSLAFVLLQ